MPGYEKAHGQAHHAPHATFAFSIIITLTKSKHYPHEITHYGVFSIKKIQLKSDIIQIKMIKLIIFDCDQGTVISDHLYFSNHHPI